VLSPWPRRLIVSISSLALLLGLTPVARAACYPLAGPASAARVATRLLLIPGEAGQPSRLLAASESGPLPAGGCLVVPVPGPIRDVLPQTSALLRELDAATAPRWVEDPGIGAGGCGGTDDEDHPSLGGGTARWGEDATDLQPAILTSPGELTGWLAGRGCDLAALPADLLAADSWAGWQFAAAWVPATPAGASPGQAVLAVTYDAASPEVGLRLFQPLVAGELDLILWVVAAHRLHGADRATLALHPPQHLSGRAFDTQYEQLLQSRLAEGGAGSLVTEFAAPLLASPALTASFAALGVVPGEAGARFLTRLRTLLPPAELARPLRLQRAADDEAVRVRILYGAGFPGLGSGSAAAGRLLGGALLLVLLFRRRRPRPGMRRWSRLACSWPAALALLLPSFTGCLPLGELRTAAIQPEGEFALSAGLIPARDTRHDLGRESPVPRTSTSPRGILPAVGATYGLGSGYDVGGLVYPLGARLDGRRALLREGEAPVALALGLSLSGFFDPGVNDRCVPSADEALFGAEDGCFDEYGWGALLDVPLTVSQQVGVLGWFAGVKLGVLLVRSERTYTAPQGGFPALSFDKEVLRGTAGIFGGVELRLGERLSLASELQILSSLSEVRRVVYYVVPGLALRFTPAPRPARGRRAGRRCPRSRPRGGPVRR